MAESGEKTELPTPKKERDAREKGQVAKSQEVVITTTLFGLIAFIWATSDSITKKLSESFELPIVKDGDFTFVALGQLQKMTDLVISITLPILGLVIFLGVAANVGQFGFLFSAESIMPKGEKISPMAGFKRIFAMKHLVEVLKSILKISILTILLIVALKANFLSLLQAIYCGIPCIGGLAGIMLGDIFKYSAGAFIVIAGFDFMYQRHTHTKSLMMSKDEIKREYKESEGDPHIKGKRRQLAHELAMGDPGVVKKSSAVVVNPTHFAVAILYDKATTPLPVTLAKGVDSAAALIRGEAESAGVPIFYSPRLARQLFADAELNKPIPSEFFEALAEILVWIDKNRDELYADRPLNRGVIDLEVEHAALKNKSN